LTQSKSAQGAIPKPDDRSADSVFKKSSPEYHIPIAPTRTEASKSHGRARARKTEADRFARNFASLIGASHFTTE
jgi:hypothetical protein